MNATIEKQNQRKKHVVNKVVSESKADFSYYFLLSLATIITTLGLTLDSEAIVVGGMLMAPLLKPILAFGLALATFSIKSIWRAAFGMINSIALVLLLSFAVSLLLHEPGFTNEQILARGTYSNLYILIAIFSGLGAAYTLMDPNIASALPGVAISVSLLPPLCVAGIALAQEKQELLFNSFGIFSANFGGIIAASVIIFLIFRFTTLKPHEEHIISKEEKNTTAQK